MNRLCAYLAVAVAAATTATFLAPSSARAEDACAVSDVAFSPSRVVVGPESSKGVDVALTVTAGCGAPELAEFSLAGASSSPTADETDTTRWHATLDIDPTTTSNSDAGNPVGELRYRLDTGSQFVAAPGLFTLLRSSSIDWDSYKRVKKGKRFVQAGRLSRADWDDGGYAYYHHQEVKLQMRTKTGRYKTVKTLDSNQGGFWTYVKTTKDRCYRWQFAGTRTTHKFTTPRQCVHVI